MNKHAKIPKDIDQDVLSKNVDDLQMFPHIPKTRNTPPECFICDAKFVNENEYNIHNMIHSSDHNCFVCKQFVKNRFQFVGHVRKHMSSKPFLCSAPNCDKIFANIRERRLHFRVHSDERPYMCTECGKSFKTIHTLREHETIHTGVKRFKCKICEGSFATGASHRRHVKAMHETVRSFQCNYCYVTFASRQAMQQHRVIHRDIDPLKCHLCEVFLENEHDLEFHKQKHVQFEESGTCEYCGTKTFYFALKEHIEKTHKPRNCKICSLVFFDDRSLENHNRSHIDAKKKEDLVCNICGKQFDFLRYLKAHLKRHQADYRKFKCELCKKAFSSKRDLNDHINVHTDVKNFKCDICGKAFRTKQSVNKHKPIHSDKRPYECKLCLKSFKKQSILRKHMITHTKVKPYKCVCGKAFKNKSSLRVHAYTHGRKGHFCKICKKRFRLLAFYKIHECQKSGTKMREKYCRDCKRYIKRPATSIYHRIGHLKASGFRCDICKADFKYKYRFVWHLCDKHKKRERNTQSDIKRERDASEVKNEMGRDEKDTVDIPDIKFVAIIDF